MSSVTPNKVSQVFAAAGQAFNRLGELTMQLHTQYEAIPGSKWTDEEVDMLRKACQKFGNDLEKVSAVIKTRTMSQVKHAIKRKVYNEAGMPFNNKQNPLNNTARKRPLPTTPNDAAKTDKTNNNVSTPTTIPIKKQKLSPQKLYEESGQANVTEKVTSDSVVDVENLDDSNASLKKLDQFISTQPSVDSRTPGGVSESAVSNPPPLPPLDLVSEQT